MGKQKSPQSYVSYDYGANRKKYVYEKINDRTLDAIQFEINNLLFHYIRNEILYFNRATNKWTLITVKKNKV